MTSYVKKIRQQFLPAYLLLILLAALTIFTASLYLHTFERDGRERAGRQLESVSDLKISELRQWRKERLGDAALFYRNKYFVDAFNLYLRDPTDSDTRDRLREWLRRLRESYSYDCVFLIAEDGTALVKWPEESADDPILAASVPSASRSEGSDFQDYYLNPLDGRIYLAVLAPLRGPNGNGVLALRINPELYLDPYIQRWPGDSRTAETLLVRREGEAVLFLNSLRHRTDTALMLRQPILPDSDLPAIRAVLGHTGPFIGRDYRGTPVLSYLSRVPDSPWFLVTKMDLAEVDGNVRDRRLILTFLVFALLGAEISGVVATTRRWRIRALEKEADAARAVQESEERLRLALAAADQGMYDLNIQTGETVVNDEYARMLGYDPATFRETNEAWIERLHPEDREPVAAVYRKYIAGEIPVYKVEFRQRTAEGGWKWILSLGKVVELDGQGRPLRMLGTHTDITTRKNAEEALRLSEERFRNTLDDMMEGCQILSFDWRYLYLNDTAVRYGRASREELIGRTLFECYPGVETTELYGVLASCMKDRKSATTESEFQFPDGLTNWFQFSVQPIPEGLFVLTLDIGERKRHERELLDLNLDLERKVEERTALLGAKNRELEAFTYSVAHDLRAPLRGIDGFARILEEEYRGVLGAEGSRLLGVVRSGAGKLDRLITDLLEYARIGRSEPVLSPVDMGELARHALSECSDPGVLGSFEIRIRNLPSVPADPGMMERIWINLLSNAIKYSLPSKTRRIEISGSRDGDWATYSIRDRGVGFDPRYSNKLFNMFQRLHSAEDFPGSGIGLAITRKLVELHGGRIWAEGTKGEGAVFSFSLPGRWKT